VRSMRVKAIHLADCDVWDVPARPAVPEGDGEGQAKTAYLAAVAPLYATLVHVTGQLGAHLLVSLHCSVDGLQLDQRLHSLARDQLAEIGDRLSAIRVPRAAASHIWAMGKTVETLQQAVMFVDLLPGKRDALDRERLMSDVIRSLHTAHKLMQVAAQPRVGLSPVDLDDICCSCTSHDRATLRISRERVT